MQISAQNPCTVQALRTERTRFNFVSCLSTPSLPMHGDLTLPSVADVPRKLCLLRASLDVSLTNWDGSDRSESETATGAAAESVTRPLPVDCRAEKADLERAEMLPTGRLAVMPELETGQVIQVNASTGIMLSEIHRQKGSL